MGRSRHSTGFTLVELMVVVLILGLLAGIALPTFMLYIRRSRSTEAVTNIQRIYASQYSYNSEVHERGMGGSFVNAPPTPSTAPASSRYVANPANWYSQPEWVALGFVLDAAHFYQYSSPADGNGFTARAVGDLDGDGARSTFSRVGVIVSGEIQADVMQIDHEFE